MQIQILTIFPDIFESFLNTSIIAKSIENKKASISVTNIRDFADPPHYRTDDSPYGGGPGMVFKPEPLTKAISAAKKSLPNAKVILLTPRGHQFNQQRAQELSLEDQVILICGRYEGIDQRVIDQCIDLELSIGDYILMGGEIPAMVVIEATLRLRDDILGNAESSKLESFSEQTQGKLLEAPQYTKPEVYNGKQVPKVLISGNHAKIEKWRKEKAIELTKARRADLLK